MARPETRLRNQNFEELRRHQNKKEKVKMQNINLSAFPTLTTKRLALRQPLESDAQEIFLLRSNTMVNKYLNRQPSETLEDALSFIKKVNENFSSNNSCYWAITYTGNKKLIGIICLYDFSDELKKCEIGYELLPDYQGQGIMNEVLEKIIEFTFNTLAFEKIDAFTHKDNLSSTRLLQKFNFEKAAFIDDTNPNLMMFRLSKLR